MAPPLHDAPRVAILGDHMLDAYIRGTVDRVCPDAPAPVLDASGELFAPGGAANVAAGCSAHGLESVACGFTGRDVSGRTLETLLAEAGVSLDGLVAVPGRDTLVKRRFCAGENVLLRVDEGTTTPEPGRPAKIARALRQVRAVLVSDYGYGSISPGVLELLASVRSHMMLLVDSKHPGSFAPLEPDIVKPNYGQATALLGERRRPDRVAHALEIACGVTAATSARACVITLDGDGCVIFRGGRARHIPAPSGMVRSTSGAGDTFLVGLAAALLEGAALPEAAAAATRQATAACATTGTATATPAPHATVAADRGKRVNPEDVAAWAEAQRREGRRIALTNGCFDIFHAGHAAFLQHAAAAGDALLVAVNSDDSVRRLKGADRPVNALDDRLRVLEAIGVVTAVTWFEDETASRVVARVKPDAYVKGSDYRGRTFPEAEYVRRHGGEVVFVGLLDGRSTTHIVERVRTAAEEVAV